MSGIKLTIIGAGSSYTPELIEGVANRKDCLPVREIALVDIPSACEKLNVMYALTRRMLARQELDIKVIKTTDRREALPGSDYIITQIRVGGLGAREQDETIPLAMGLIGQETTGSGGFAKALRTIPVILDIAKDIQALCPDAFLINFTNPAGIITETVLTHSRVKCIGLCNVPINMERGIANHLNVPPREVFCQFAGLNHLCFIKKILLHGTDITPRLLQEKAFQQNIVANISDVEGMDRLSAKLGVIPSPYLGYYYFEPERLAEERENLRVEGGTRATQVMTIEKELFALYADPALTAKPPQLAERGGALYSEAAVSLIESIHNDRNRLHVANVCNRGAIGGLPEDCVVETNCVVGKNGAWPLASGSLPDHIRPLVQTIKAYEQLTIAAAITGDRKLAFQALLLHPLVHGANNAEKLLTRILDANKAHLPAFAH